jgi:uncharacterized protein DUF5677
MKRAAESDRELGPCPVSLDGRVDGELVRLSESATRLVVESLDAVGQIAPADARAAAVRLWHLGLGAACVSLCRGIVTLVLRKNARAVEPLYRMLIEHVVRLKYFEADEEEAEYQWVRRPIDFLALIKDLGIAGERVDRIAADADAAAAALPAKWSAKSVKDMVIALEGSKERGVATYANIYRWPSQGAHSTTVGISTAFETGPDGRQRLDIYGETLDPNEALAMTTAGMVMLASQFDAFYALRSAVTIKALEDLVGAIKIRLGLAQEEISVDEQFAASR